MTRRLLPSAVTLAALAVAAFAADLPSAWKAWRYCRSIQTSPAASPVYCSAHLAVQVFPHSQASLADLRIIDESGAEIPYSLTTESGGSKTESRHAELRENSYVPGQYTQVLLDLGKHSAFHNAVKIATSETDFMNWVEVAASDDTQVWRIVKERAPIPRFQRENLAGNQTVRYSQNNARYLRLRIQEAGHPFPVTGAEVYFTGEVIELVREPVPVKLVLDSSAPHSITRWTTDFGPARYPLSEVDFTTPQQEFFRAVRVQTSEDGREWSFCAAGEIYRYKVGDKLEESLRVPLYGQRGAHYWRVEVLNQDDAPLDSLSAQFLMHSRRLYFAQKPGHAYRVVYGNPRAEPPRYDLTRITDVSGYKSTPLLVELGEEELNANYADPRPFTERHPNVLWVALGAAVLLLGYAALRALRPVTA